MFPSSGDPHHSRDRTSRRSGAASRVPSPYHELSQWESDEDLIQLDSPELKSDDVTLKDIARTHNSKDGRGMSQQGGRDVPRLREQPSLLDLYDYPRGRAEEELDETPTPRLHADWNAKDQNFLHETSTTSNSTPWEHLISPALDSQHCVLCQKDGFSVSYCNVCNESFCGGCWNSQITHQKNRLAPGAVPHEKTDHNIAKTIQTVLEVKTTDEEQAVLHQNDQDTTWFGITRHDGELPIFQDYGRYATLMTNTSRSERSRDFMGVMDGRDTRYPSLVSFVGQTGAGKSTIIKLVIDLSARKDENHATPVVGPAGKDIPTSGDVHLYSDPQTAGSDAPILYADCEGLDGGEREPLGAWRKARDKSGQTGPIEQKSGNIKHGSEREITWATSNLKKSRGFAVTHLYPRLLYTFSDVIVFVLKNPRVIESVFENLVNWAAAALETSSNQPVLPCAIILLNASENHIDPELWDVQMATASLLDSLSRTVFKSPVFKKYAQFWRERHRRIETVEDLLLSYYSSISVVRIPTSGRPNLINKQIQRLYATIQAACASARRRKGELRMLLDADELQPYLQFAFDHFARNLDTPFDFVQASFTNSPIPLNFGGNILKLAINLMEVWENEADGRILFVELSYMVASCIMLDSARHKLRGTAEQIFPHYLEHIDAALENFCDRHWPCEYIKSGGGARCVNVRSGHGSKGHQRKNGKVLAVGGYVSSFSFEGYCEEFQNEVYIRLKQLLKILHSRVEEDDQPEAQAAAEIHKDKVMAHFFGHAARGRTNSFISHSTCFSCLFEPPEHALPCGHVLCTLCLRAYGKSHEETMVDIVGCPMDKLITRRHQSWRVLLKPAAAGIRILTLDGGGIRGIAELETLRQIERAIGGGIALQCFFDLIVGTSTGGIIALGLGAKNWSVEECTRHFEELCQKAFTRRTGGNIPGVGWFIDNYNHSKYETQPLEEALIGSFSEKEHLFGGTWPYASSGSDIKVAVTTTSAAGIPVILTNYNRICGEKLSYHFQRPERLASEVKIWEAARATSAAPRIFKPLCHGPSKQTYVDGAIYHNNPIQIADQERKLIWPSMKNEFPDIVLSIGTTFYPNSRSSGEKAPGSRLGVWSHGKSLYKMAIDRIASTIDSEKMWETYMSILQPPLIYRPKYVRLNPKLDEEPPRLDEVHRMEEIKGIVRKKWLEGEEIRNVAHQLVASSFYFEKSAPMESTADQIFRCRGYICCRLLQNSSEISELGKFLRSTIQNGPDPFFLISENGYRRHTERVFLNPSIIERMIRRRSFAMSPITLQLSEKLAITEISLCLGERGPSPISRFPRSLLEDDDLHEKTRQNLNSNSMRWISRRGNQQKQRIEWVPPELSYWPRQDGMMSHYSDPGYVIGNSTTQELDRITQYFKFGNHMEPKSPAELPGFETLESLASAVSTTNFQPTVAELPTPEPLIREPPSSPFEIAELPGSQIRTLPDSPSTWSLEDARIESSLPNHKKNRLEKPFSWRTGESISILGDQHVDPRAPSALKPEDSNMNQQRQGSTPGGRKDAWEGGFF